MIAALALLGFHRRPVMLFGLLFFAAIATFLDGLRRRIPFSRSLFGIALVLTWLLLGRSWTLYLSPLPLAYVTVFLGLQNPRKTLLVVGADYSYGVYLYGFPIQQAICGRLPGYRIWYVNLLLGLVVTGLCAYLSWHLLESRVLARKKAVTRVVSAGATWLSRRLKGRLATRSPWA